MSRRLTCQTLAHPRAFLFAFRAFCVLFGVGLGVATLAVLIDAVSGWQAPTVLAPPVLVPRDGRPSPQIQLQFPASTGLPPQDLPDGSTTVEAVTGTVVHVRAACDRPVRARL